MKVYKILIFTVFCLLIPLIITAQITVNSGMKVTIRDESKMTVTGNTTINSGAEFVLLGDMSVTGNFTNNGSSSAFLLSSNASSTGSLIISGTSTGDVNIEQYLTDNSWHLVSPTTTDVTANNYYWSDNPMSWLSSHTESTNEWTYNTDLGTSMPVGKGWSVWLDNAARIDATTTMSGALQVADKTVSLDYSGSGSTQGWNLIGNPFAAAIDRDLGTWGSNTSGAVYVWVDGDSDYRYYTSGSGGTLTDGIIPIGQGFFVKSSSAGDFVIPASARVHSSQAFYKFTEENERPFVRLDLTVGDFQTVAFVGFPDGGTSEFDINLDVDRLYGSTETPQMIFPEDERILCIKASEPLLENEERIIPLHVRYFIDGEYEFMISDLQQLPDVKIQLEDLKTGVLHDLTTNNMYNFSAHFGDVETRFLLHFMYSPNEIFEQDINQNNDIKIYSWNHKINIISKGAALDKTGIVMIYDMQGRIIKEQHLDKSELITIPVNTTATCLIVKVVKENTIKTTKVILN